MESINQDWLVQIADDLVKEKQDATIKDFIELKEELEAIASIQPNKTNQKWQEH